MLLTWLLFYPVWFLAICILEMSIYYKFESIILFFSFKKKEKLKVDRFEGSKLKI